jgi:anti-sigma factor RsiW
MDIDLGGWSMAPLEHSMDCNRFENGLSDYFDGLLEPAETSLFRAHSLQCRACRSLMDDVKTAINACQEQREVEPSLFLERSLEAIPTEHRGLDCSGFEELVTEFLDGFVPAPTYHRFEEHATQCDHCSSILTDVVYAVAACHSVHTFEEVDVPAPLLDRLIALMPERQPGFARQVAAGFVSIARIILSRPTQSARWTFATAASLAFATFALLLFGFSDDGTVSGVYRQAHVKFSELYTQGADVYTQTDKLVARLERVGLGIGEFWDTLGGDDASHANRPEHNQEPNANKRVETSEKN